MAKKKSPKKKSPRAGPAAQTYLYNIVDVDISKTTAELNEFCNAQGQLGWELLSLGIAVQGTTNLLRLWFIQPGV